MTGMLRRSVIAGLVTVALIMATVSTALAAQGVITEVNPSGVASIIATTDGPMPAVKVRPRSAKGIIVDVNPSGAVSVKTPGKPGFSNDFGARD